MAETEIKIDIPRKTRNNYDNTGAVIRIIFYLLILLGYVDRAVSYEEVDLTIPLRFGFTSKIPSWAMFGSIDSREFTVRFVSVKDQDLGRILSDEGYAYTLLPHRSINDYFNRALSSVLTNFGISIEDTSQYVLAIAFEHIRIDALSTQENSLKRCTIKIRAVVTCQNTVLCDARIENVGKKEFDSDEEDDYAELLDGTLRGLFIKLWGSRVLFTDVPLGKGIIIKKDLGVYGFVPQSFADELAIPDSTLIKTAAQTVVNGNRIDLPKSGLLSGAEKEVVGENILTGTYTSKDSIVLDDGKRITIGILPFENATGQEKLASAAREVREILQVELAKARTIKVMDREKLTEVLQEQALGLTGIMNDSTVVNVGNISGVRAMVSGKVTTTGSYYRLSARIINVETSAIVAAVSVTSADAHQIADAVPELASKLLYAFTEEKIAINRNTMSYPSVSPLGIGAVTASVEDAWAVEINPASLMKVRQKDANFYISFAKKLSGHLTNSNGPIAETWQPPFEKIGVNVALPIGLRFAGGFGIRHQYTYPRFKAAIGANAYDIKEEETVFTLPLAWGINPKLSIGVNARTHILEYQITNPGSPYYSGNVVFMDAKIGGVFKISERFKAGMTFKSESFNMRAKEKSGTTQEYVTIDRDVPTEFRFGTAMYPWKWWFFFADLVYEKQPEKERIQPGFHLGTQFTYTGKPFSWQFMPAYGMIPLYIGYSHNPYNNATNTQAKYVSFGTGYYLNNIYVQCSMRFNVEKEADRKIVIGLPGKSTVTLYDYSLISPLLLCIGYRF